MKTIKNKQFSGDDIMLDDHHYENCKFMSCKFIYAATGGFRLRDNTISNDCTFEFRGAAADTLNTMKAIYGMGEFGRKVIFESFKVIAPDITNLH